MDGIHSKSSDYDDPFSAGQMVGMMVVLSIIEKSGGIDDETSRRLRHVAADGAQKYLGMPSEDIHLLIDRLIEKIGQ